MSIWDDIMHVMKTKIAVFSKGIYTSGNSHTTRIGSPEHPQENKRYMRIWDDIMHVK